ncbi:MAG: anthranilate phosphoribosyltransferase [Caldicoprobacter sp.]|uniref:Anthranilate phosphoribosyltransferase n=1 Tax=Caldicoprobacter faecalis TaxID=937334 RepID=A0A1I5SCE2_9FIRM|nr:anthranilate phosphoribosyltransferase [Caldicoprobacter faecalis]PZN10073.1 MAG: anthranilate phosphoribosyltransferase [Caldicoprobacter oshimai]SFP68187.1 anthranilate phosphoribosyltransferase [Caldicoprobacter faecalis]
MLSEALKKIVSGEHLTQQEAALAMDDIMDGNATPSQIGAFLVALRMKGETIPEITGCAVSMRLKAKRVELDDYAIDTCGTGGDGGRTFNISTAVAIIAAAAGVKVAKHGNRAVSSKSGSADVLEALGVKIEMSPEMVVECIKRTHIGFLFAPHYHVSMKNVVGPRRELGVRTIFNILGPLTNPAGVKGQVLGVYDRRLVHSLAEVLKNLGTQRALVVHGMDGLDEITTTTRTIVSEIKGGEIIDYEIDPAEYGIPYARLQDIAGGDAKHNAELIMRILKGERGPARDIVLLNAAAALYVGNAAESIREGLEKATYLIDSGAAYEKLKEFIRVSREVGHVS